MRRRVVFPIGCILVSALAVPNLSAQSAPALPLLPNGAAYDAAGNLYFADTNRHQIYESTLAGVLTIVAGNGTQGFSGDEGPAISAQLNSPEGVAIGPDGTLYIADTGNQRIRAVIGGQITTFAGSGVAGFSGDAGPAIAASFRRPSAIAIDASGALLVCDTINQRVRRVAGDTITTIAGSGTQGFAGDGAAATAALLDTPSGLSVGSDGKVYIADSHNNRVRVIGVDGTITTFAGTGIQGFAGDSGAAKAAQLSLPRGLIASSTGTLLIADSNNQRLRLVSAQGTISTIVGSGVQGSSFDGVDAGTAALDTPSSAVLSTFGSPVFTDAGNRLVRESVGPDALYLPAGLALNRTSAASLSVAATSTYGQSTASVTVTGTAGTPQGLVQLLDGTILLAQTSLVAGVASFDSGVLASGSHQLTARYLGDGVNPATASGPIGVNVTAASVIASAFPVLSEYGQTIPALTGSLSGVLPQDIGAITAVFTTPALPLSAPGTYPITARLTGSASANYSVVLGPASGSLQIDQAQSQTSEPAIAQNSYEGLPLVLTANVASTTQGTPTGTVTFSDAGTPVATATLTGGIASATYLSPAAGAHSIVANYLGDTDFMASASVPVTTIVGAMPDFSIAAAGSTTQTVSAGDLASYTLLVSAQPAPFTGAVTLSAGGFPAGAVVTFSPTQTVPGAGSATVTMSVHTAASTSLRRSFAGRNLVAVSLVLTVPLLLRRRRYRLGTIFTLVVTAVCLGSLGCGARSISTAALVEQTYAVKVTATGTSLSGAVLAHSVTVTLIVR